MNRVLLLECGEALTSAASYPEASQQASRRSRSRFDPFQVELATTFGRTARVTLEVAP
ncbi:MAG: hypothetical protein Q8S33_02435 [Myxococcales bacterium]|nr:hypothetical protein [Myxococcales bacterium]